MAFDLTPWRPVLLWICLVVTTQQNVGCAHETPKVVLKKPDGSLVEKPAKPEQKQEAEASALLTQADQLTKSGDQPGAKSAYERLLGEYPATGAAATLRERLGNEADAGGHTKEALEHFEKLLFYRPDFERADAIRERYGDLLLRVGRSDDAVAMFEGLFGNAKNTDDRLRLLDKYAASLQNTQRSREAISAYVKVLSSSTLTPAQRQALEHKAVTLLASGLKFSEAEPLWQEVEDDSAWKVLHAALAFKLAKIYFHTRRFDSAQRMLTMVTTRFKNSTYSAQADALLKHLQARSVVVPNKIGVLLPLSGRYRQYGERALIAIKMAIPDNAGIELVIKDTAGEPETAAAAIEKLVLEDHVVAVMGELFSKPAEAAAAKAEEYSVPFVALSHLAGLPQMGPHVFRTALTVEAQAQTLARVAFEQLGMARFAILYPRTHYGEEFTAAFWDEVDKRRGQIRGVETYAFNQTTFRDEVRKLVGRYYLHARPDYEAAVKELAAQKLNPVQQRHAMSQLDKTLHPIVDFDALVIPDTGRNIGLIAPALAFEDIVLTHDKRTLEKIKKATNNEELHPITLLGASTWNTPQTVDSCAPYCEGAVFVDAFFPDSTRTQVRDFVTTFTERAADAPRLSEAQAFDTAALLRALVAKARPLTREAFRAALKTASHQGVTGALSFDAQGEAQKDLFVLTIKNGAIKQYDPTDRPPQG